MPTRTKLIEELRSTAERITRYTNSPYDGLMSAAADMLEADGKYDQQAMELCDVCGWKAKMDGEQCLVCQSQQIDKLQAAAQLGLDAFDKMTGRKPEFVEQAVAALRQALK